MNYVENNGKKVAAVLCVASCFPVVATVYAMETEPGWHGDKYIKEDATVAKGWQEIEGKSYYFSEEDGAVEKETTQKAVVASVSSSISGDVQETVANVAKEAVVEEVQKIEEETVEQAPVLPEENKEPEANNTENNGVIPQQPAPEVEQSAPEVETPVQPEVEQPAPEVETPVQPEVEQPAPEVEAPVQPEVEQPAPEVETPVLPEVQEPAPEVETPAPEVQAPVDQYADLNVRIAEAAKTLVGVTDGQWCTEVVQQALALAGVSDAAQLWPDQYVGQYGYYTDTPKAGNLIYYNNGGRGTDHIAIYIGNGLAVHGNYNGRTVIETAYVPGAGTPQFIQVCR